MGMVPGCSHDELQEFGSRNYVLDFQEEVVCASIFKPDLLKWPQFLKGARRNSDKHSNITAVMLAGTQQLQTALPPLFPRHCIVKMEQGVIASAFAAYGMEMHTFPQK